MRNVTIYLAHALTSAPPGFLERMLSLKNRLAEIPGVKILDFASAKGPEFIATTNVYWFDMVQVQLAGLVVAVLDHPSDGRGMEVQMRCQLALPLRCFFKKGDRVSRIISDCIKRYRATVSRSPIYPATDLPDPIEYETDEDIVRHVREWVEMRLDTVPVPA